ncbi:P-loop containing nucleoside triphosphate hydrolase protein [Bombardia bombarda]|uniref:P-loop containing nucleoside triphosphate hydrolase protein n=1 Tax=Bombardia bombarda TaxID=252184 RepID=A0AA39U7N2_9PEZI|nr:P-loop containing nucleoside triphosphate hydrolase protein [Bombardia bombarda]
MSHNASFCNDWALGPVQGCRGDFDLSLLYVSLPAQFTASLALEVALLALEIIERKGLAPEWQNKSPEETAGVLSRSLLVWLSGILAKGRKTLLSPTDLDPLREGLATRQLSDAFRSAWNSKDNSKGKLKDSRYDHPSLKLVFVLIRALKWSLGDTTFVGSVGYGFVITYGVVYIGLAVSACIYWRLTYQSLVKLRGCIISAVYEHTIEMLSPVSVTYALPSTSSTTDAESANDADTNLALKDISIAIQAGQKVAICGRSGSGKSTLLAALASMIELASGNIFTVAKNVNPLNNRSADQVRTVLEKVNMWETISANGGVDAEIDLDSLSQGQKQLLALARALLKGGNLVLMDEATSSVDQHTAELISLPDKTQRRTSQDPGMKFTALPLALFVAAAAAASTTAVPGAMDQAIPHFTIIAAEDHNRGQLDAPTADVGER